MRFFLLLLPTVVFATIDVKFNGIIDFERGQVRGVFDSKMYDYFHDYIEGNDFSKIDLKNIIEASNGKRPDEVYFNSPENQSNLYKENGLQEVRKTIIPIEVNAIQVKTKDILVAKKSYDNYEDRPKKAVIDVSLMIQHKVTSDWRDKVYKNGDNVHLDMKFRVNCGNTKIDQTFDWEHKKVARITDLLQEKEQTVIAPGEEVIGELHAKIGLVQFTIDYNVSLTGDVVAVYNDMYKGKKHHIFNISDLLLTARGVTSSHITTQIVSYQFYYGAFLKIVENKTIVSKNDKKKLSGIPIANSNERDEKEKTTVEVLDKIKMGSKNKLKNYIFEEIGEGMYTGLKDKEKKKEQNESSEESVEN